MINRKVSDIPATYDAEDDVIIDNFMISNPDFSGLDNLEFDEEGNTKLDSVEQQTAPKTLEVSEAEEISLDDFNVEYNEEKVEFEEVIGFGSVENNIKKEPVDLVKFDIEPAVPDYNMLDKKIVVKKGKKKAVNVQNSEFGVKNIMNQVQTESQDDDVAELSAADVDIPFTLTQFGAVTSNPEELKPYVNVIHEDESGLYMIKTEGADMTPVNMDFKNLVDSVLGK